HKANLDRERSAWQDCCARVEGLRKLGERYMDEARRLGGKREEKLLGEL
ncbi:flagella biosynthesis chaperone FliJ, partial [Pseudomonas syringae pv. tagetis]